jgi:hypothetical protein
MATKQRIMMLDVTPEGHVGTLVVQYTLLGPGDPVTDQEVLDFLAHFRIGPNH